MLIPFASRFMDPKAWMEAAEEVGRFKWPETRDEFLTLPVKDEPDACYLGLAVAAQKNRLKYVADDEGQWWGITVRDDGLYRCRVPTP
jgi:hypothetical protein